MLKENHSVALGLTLCDLRETSENKFLHGKSTIKNTWMPFKISQNLLRLERRWQFFNKTRTATRIPVKGNGQTDMNKMVLKLNGSCYGTLGWVASRDHTQYNGTRNQFRTHHLC